MSCVYCVPSVSTLEKSFNPIDEEGGYGHAKTAAGSVGDAMAAATVRFPAPKLSCLYCVPSVST